MDRKHIVSTVVALIAAAGCASNGTSGSATTPARVTASSASASPSAPSCKTQYASWNNSDAQSRLEAVYIQTGKLATADNSLASDLFSHLKPSVAEAAVRTAAASVKADVAALDEDLPPTCVPKFRQDLQGALADIAKAAMESALAVSDVSRGIRVATGDIGAAHAAEGAGAAKLTAALADLKAFEHG
jgi:hypothetical protein